MSVCFGGKEEIMQLSVARLGGIIFQQWQGIADSLGMNN